MLDKLCISSLSLFTGSSRSERSIMYSFFVSHQPVCLRCGRLALLLTLLLKFSRFRITTSTSVIRPTANHSSRVNVNILNFYQLHTYKYIHHGGVPSGLRRKRGLVKRFKHKTLINHFERKANPCAADSKRAIFITSVWKDVDVGVTLPSQVRAIILFLFVGWLHKSSESLQESEEEATVQSSEVIMLSWSILKLSTGIKH